MKMRLMCLLLQLLLAFAFTHQVHSQSPPGFISLDCGLRVINGYNDAITGLYYSTDGAYIETGEGRSISPEFQTNSVPRQFLNLRSFPGPSGTRNCYTFIPLYGKLKKILLRVGFMYGNYDDQRTVPQFDMYLGVDIWETVTFKDSSSFFITEIIHKPTSDYVHVCLVNTGLGTPFISVIELRPIDPPTFSAYNPSSGSLKFFARWDMGSTSNNFVRYKDDDYDRIWKPVNQLNTTILSSNAASFNQNFFDLPPVILNTAAQAPSTQDPLVVTFVPNNSSDQFYFYVHFAELVANQSREMTIYLNGYLWYKPFVPPYLTVSSLLSSAPYSSSAFVFIINSTTNSKLPAILNAIEAYTVKQFPHSETNESDVAAIIGIKTTYGITRNWQGDVCLPKDFAWIGINCSYNGFEPPTIISLNLSSSGLTGTIAPAISNLTMLQSLDLSFNNLTGPVPEFLAWLPSLRYLYLQGNNFTGSLPPALLEKSNNGSLVLSIIEVPDNYTNLCANDACKKKKNPTVVVPVVASVVGFFAIVTLSALICLFIRRKRKVMQRVRVESNRENDGSSIEPKLRQLTFAEVTNLIAGKIILGEGGFGTVYHCCMNGVEVAVKVLKVSPAQETKDFQAEVKILSTVYHRNLTKILGYCNEGVNKAIIYELIENGNLKHHLSERNSNVLSWELRLSILVGTAEGLGYLHHGCNPPIIHRDIKPENILLTREFEAKLADFGLSRIFHDESAVNIPSSRIVGTPGYLDPEYIHPRLLTEKVDVYSFGVVMLVVITGRTTVVEETTHITQWVREKVGNGDIRGIVDPRMEGNYNVNVAWRVVELAMACVSTNSSTRPNMNYAARELKECLPQTVPQQRRRSSNDAAGIALTTSNMRSVFRPNTR